MRRIILPLLVLVGISIIGLPAAHAAQLVVDASVGASSYAVGQTITVTGKVYYVTTGPQVDSTAKVIASLTPTSGTGSGTTLGDQAGVDVDGKFTLTKTLSASDVSAGSYRVTIIATSSSNTQSNPFFIPVSITPATGGSGATGGGSQAAGTSTGLGISIPNPLGSCNNATCLISRIIKSILGLVAIVATFMFVWGGILMLTSSGNERQVKQARDTLVWAAIGIIIILISWTLIKFVLDSFLNRTSTPALTSPTQITH